jgi:hypothetical protein
VPTVIIDGYKFRFYSSDIDEPPHIHVIRDEKQAKIWLETVRLEYNRSYNQRELNQIVRLVEQNRERLLEVWNEYFSL